MKKVLFASLLLLTSIGLHGNSHATTVSYADFSSTAGLTLSGDAAQVGNVLRLAQDHTWSGGSAFSSQTINAAKFSTAFKFQFSNRGGIHDGVSTGADGIVFVIQNVSSSIGGAGYGMGYAGIPTSIGVEFDTWGNWGYDPSSNHIGIDTNGNVASLITTNVNPPFDNYNAWYAWIDYDGTTLSVRANQTGVRPDLALLSYNLNVASIIGSPTAYVGFTGATGAAYENHDILSWEYRDEFKPIGSPVPEPSTFILLGAGIGGFALLRRRSTKS